MAMYFPPIYGIKLGGKLIILGIEPSAGEMDMPRCFFSRKDAEEWLRGEPDFQHGKVVPLNESAASCDYNRVADAIPLEHVPPTPSCQYLGAFWRGVRAAATGVRCRDNPYKNSPSYSRFWRDGHDAGMRVLLGE